MAKSKKRKKAQRQRQAAFYEAIPMAITPPLALPQIDNPLGARPDEFLAQALKSFSSLHKPNTRQWAKAGLRTGRAALLACLQGTQRVLSWTMPKLLQGGLATTIWLVQAGQTTRLTLRFTAEAIGEYAPPLGADIRLWLRRLARLLASRRSRLVYLTLGGLSLSGLLVFALVSANATIRTYAHDLSSPATLLAKKHTGITITDRNGAVLYEGYGASSAKPVELKNLPQSLKDATLAAEDPNFYDHPGFSWKATARAAWVNLTRMGKVEGGSTLTQQLVKNALLTSDKAYQRKYQELLLSMELERHYSKDQILEMYLNEIYYGQGSSGVEAAAQTYFHKSAHDLTIAESALLAGLPLGPSRLDPTVHPDEALGRRDYVIGRMVELGKITKAQGEAAKAEPIIAHAKNVEVEAPWFVFYVLDQLRAQYGNEAVEQGGMKVRTTLDLGKQTLAQTIVAQRVGALAEHHVTNGGLVSLEPATGDILAMVGSVDYNAPGFGNVNVMLSQLQPGSSFKPIAYATAFKKGWNGATHVDDVPLSVPNADGTYYTPQNYDLKFHGSVSLRHALGNSLNIPAVKVLQFAGIHDTIQTAHDLGITSLQDESRFGLALVLGGGEVRPLDMATVYGAFANSGIRHDPRAILAVTDRYGKDITKPATGGPKEALDPRIAYMLTNILSDDGSRQPEFPANGPLKLSRPAAAKTGTTNDFRDNWTVGYTPQLVTAVWVGNNDHSAMQNIDGITGAAPIWHDYMEAALQGTPALDFPVPPGITTAKVCLQDGGLANPWDSGREEVFMSDAMPAQHCKTQPKPSDAIADLANIVKLTLPDITPPNPDDPRFKLKPPFIYPRE